MAQSTIECYYPLYWLHLLGGSIVGKVGGVHVVGGHTGQHSPGGVVELLQSGRRQRTWAQSILKYRYIIYISIYYIPRYIIYLLWRLKNIMTWLKQESIWLSYFQQNEIRWLAAV